ncbi:hypothetical protein Tco_1391831 [Tanacetum coccineum]
MQVTLLLMTPWRESHANRCDRVFSKGRYKRYCSERVCLERSGVQFLVIKIDGCYEDVSRPSVVGVLVSNGRFELSKGGNQIPILRKDLFGGMAVKKTSFPEMESSGSIVVSIPELVKD